MYHVVEDGNDGLKRMKILTESCVKLVNEGSGVMCMNLIVPT